MNRKPLVLSLTGAMLLLFNTAFSNSIDYISNLSADFLMNQSRNAATDSATIVAYNPAGTALMNPGFYASVSNQTLFPKLDEEFKNPDTGFDEKYKNRKIIPAIPHFYMVYNMGNAGIGNLAFSMKGGIIASGGTFDWDGTTALAYTGNHVADTITGLNSAWTTELTSTDIKQTVSSLYFGLGFNAAYSMFSDRVSLSAGAQGITAEDTSDISGKLYFNTPDFGGEWNMDIDSTWVRKAKGYNFTFGLDVRPVEKLTIGVRYETEAALRFKYDQDTNDVTSSTTSSGQMIVDLAAEKVKTDALEFKGKTDYNLPSVFAYGIEYQITPELLVATGGTLYFLSSADMDGYENNWKQLGYEVNLGGTYAVIPSTLKIGIGVTLADVGGKKSLHTNEEQEVMGVQGAKSLINKVILVGTGLTYTVFENLDLTLSYGYLTTLGKEKATTDSGYNVSYFRELHLVGIQASSKF